jgi:hypothetical protein
MSQSEDKKDITYDKVKVEQEDNRLPVGELKWKKEQQQKEEQEKEQEIEEIEAKEKEAKKEDKEVEEKESVNSEVSATLLDVEKEQETTVSSQDEGKKDKQNPLDGIEDTLTPIDFKTYEFDAEQLKAIEKELNSLNPEKLEEELHSMEKQQNPPDQVDYRDDQEDEKYTTDSRWVKRSIWILGIPALLVIVLFVSLIIGHTVVGGQPVSDIFDISMWIHVYNLIYG